MASPFLSASFGAFKVLYINTYFAENKRKHTITENSKQEIFSHRIRWKNAYARRVWHNATRTCFFGVFSWTCSTAINVCDSACELEAENVIPRSMKTKCSASERLPRSALALHGWAVFLSHFERSAAGCMKSAGVPPKRTARKQECLRTFGG